MLRRLKADPLKYLAQRFNTADDDAPEKIDLALELLPYAYPKLKAVEHKSDFIGKITVTIGGEDDA